MKKYFLKFKEPDGFTLIEILVVASLMVFVTVLSVRNLTESRLNLERLANVMASDVRLAQQLSLSSHQHQGPLDPAPRNRCGYGITNKPNDNSDPNNDRKYQIYAGPPTVDAGGNPISCGSTNYQQSQDYPFYKSVILDSRVDFVVNPRFSDVFYVPPAPTTYIQNSNTPSNLTDPATYYEKITIKKVGVTKQTCDAGSVNCIFVCVYYSGRVEVSKSPTCPAPY